MHSILLVKIHVFVFRVVFTRLNMQWRLSNKDQQQLDLSPRHMLFSLL